MNAYTATVPQLQTSALIRELTPAQITGTASDYAPPGRETYNVWRLSSDASRNLTGMVGGPYGTGETVRLLINVGSQNIVLKHENAGSQAANRFSLTNSQDQTINPNDCALCRYDVGSSRWRVLLGLDYAAIVALAARVTTAEGNITTLQGNVATLTAQEAADAAAILALQTTVTNHETRITALEALRSIYGYVPTNQVLTASMADVSTISFAVAALATYHFTMTIIYKCTPAADFQWQVIGPSGCLAFMATSQFVDASSVTLEYSTLGLSTPVNAIGNSSPIAIEVSGTIVNGGNAGVVKLQAAQNTPTVEITDLVMVGTNSIATRVG